jgi:subtilase family serine protease
MERVMLRIANRLSAYPGAVLAALLACAGVIGSPAVAQLNLASPVRAVPLVHGSIDETKRVILRGNTRPEVLRAEFDRGPVDDSFPMNGMQLLLKRSPAHQKTAEDLADELHRSGSPSFHQWLTAEQFADRFGADSTDVAKVRDWLTAHGFTVHPQKLSRMTVEFSGTAGQVRETFGTEIHALEVKGARHIANANAPDVPAALAAAIDGFVSLTDFRPKSMAKRYDASEAHLSQTGSTSNASVTQFTIEPVVPADLATIYNFTPLFAAGITGAGQTIATTEDSDVYNEQDWHTFRKVLGLDAIAKGSLKTVHPGDCGDPGVTLDDFEAILDVEWASAAAPGATVWSATCPSTTTTYGGDIALQNLLNEALVPQIISISFGQCEAFANNSFNKEMYLQGVLEGVSVYVASGDQGAGFCDFLTAATSGISVNGYASTVYNVAVGSTDFSDTYSDTKAEHWAANPGRYFGRAINYVPEIPWNDSCASALISEFLGYATPFGADGFCAVASTNFTIPFATTGGPSNCATGTPAGPPTITGALPSNGTCKGWPKPRWQRVAGNPNDEVRDTPDIAMFGSDGVWNHFVVLCDTDLSNSGAPCTGSPLTAWVGAGGTSVSAPIMAGVQALVNQTWGGRQGNPNPVLYAIGSAEHGPRGNASCNSSASPSLLCVFNDITLGDNDIDCIPPYNCFDPHASQPNVLGVLSLSDTAYKPAFKAGVAWDFTTGLGSVNAMQLVLNPIWLFGAGP